MTKTYDNLFDYDYQLPEELIASKPIQKRDNSRLLIVEQNNFSDLLFKDIINYINADDLLILNDSKVIKARLFGQKLTGGRIEVLLERIINNQSFLCHLRSNKTIPIGLTIKLPNDINAIVTQRNDGLFILELTHPIDLYQYFEQYGSLPLPPYMNRQADAIDSIYYQTIYAKDFGSVASPTAGLHFTQELLNNIQQRGTKIAYVTLHVGSGTFKPVMVNNINEHKMHSEEYSITRNTIDLIKQTKQKGGKIIAVGTTSLRTLESIANNNFEVGTFNTDIFIRPGFKFKVVDKLITNFHLPKSTLLMLVSAFAGFDQIKHAYQHAIANRYRFFSYGDAMLLNRKE
ncbi:MAG: tRNA preQ1(34) S-adenosylmethionine ribosyltransferase-isomerase QueA [Neisseriaceae bacterium]